MSKGQPKKTWTKIKRVYLGDLNKNEVTIELYTEKENEKPYTNGDVYALLKFKQEVLFIGNVSPSLGLDDVDMIMISKEFGDLFLLGGIGTKFTYWTTIGYNGKKGNFVQFKTVGKPKMVNFNNTSHIELVGIWGGVHTHPPNVFIFRWKNETLQVSNIKDSIKNQNGYVVLEQAGEKWLFKIGLLSPETNEGLYRYNSEKLIRVK